MLLLRQLFDAAGGGPETDAFKHLAAAFTVLRSLGSAKTQANSESSRIVSRQPGRLGGQQPFARSLFIVAGFYANQAGFSSMLSVSLLNDLMMMMIGTMGQAPHLEND